MNMTEFNQEVFENATKNMFEEYGDFLQDYNKKVLGHPLEEPTEKQLNNQMNLA